MFENIKKIADALEPELKALSLAIHDHPELGEEEFIA